MYIHICKYANNMYVPAENGVHVKHDVENADKSETVIVKKFETVIFHYLN